MSMFYYPRPSVYYIPFVLIYNIRNLISELIILVWDKFTLTYLTDELNLEHSLEHQIFFHFIHYTHNRIKTVYILFYSSYVEKLSEKHNSSLNRSREGKYAIPSLKD